MKIHTTDPQPVIKRALTALEAFISPTYGPAGRGVLIDTGYDDPSVIDDGFAAVEQFELEDEMENAVIKLIREVTRKTNSRAGDGTTTAVLTAIAAALRSLEQTEGSFVKPDVSKISKELRIALGEAITQIRAASVQIETEAELEKIAYSSFKNPEIAKLVASLVHKVGKNGVVSLEDSDSAETTGEVISGYAISHGYLSPYFADEGEVKLTNPVIILTDETIENVEQISGLMEEALKNGRTDFLFIAHDVNGAALSSLILNKMRGAIKVAAIRAPGGASERIALLEDIGAFVNGTVYAAKSPSDLSTLSLSGCGNAASVTVTDTETVILHGAGTDVAARVENIKQLTTKGTEYEKEKARKRIALLTDGVAIIHVGAKTSAERKAVRMKIEDAVNATVLALKEGIVPGAGKTYLALKTSSEVFNAALAYPRAVLERNGKDALSDDVQDATGVAIAALESAVSIASELITMSGISTLKREDKNKATNNE